MEQQIEDYGMVNWNGIQIFTIIGEIEGHDCLSSGSKTTKYEHILPLLAKAETDTSVKGMLFLMNTIGGDVSCGLALAEMIASLSKPTVSLVLGDSHSIGVPLAVFLYNANGNDDHSPGPHEWSGSGNTTDVFSVSADSKPHSSIYFKTYRNPRRKTG